MTPRRRVEAVLMGEKPDKIPFTVYENKLPQCSVERQLRNEGLCIVERRYSVFRIQTPNVRVESISYTENGVLYIRRNYYTPVGELFTIERPAGFTTWHICKLFKSPEDYKPLLFMIKDQQIEPTYESFIRAQEMLGEDVTLRVNIGSTPLHQIMIHWMGLEKFAVEWLERRDEIEKLYNAMVEKHRKIYEIVAHSPALHVNYGGNETGDVMGRERFEKYVLPLYNEAAEVLHPHGKLLGAHLDGNNRVWADLVAQSGLDYIEAFTPSPDTDMTIEEAFKLWKDKVLWINFPSSVHLKSVEEIEETARQIIEASKPDYRLIIGITEDVPEDRWQGNFLAISRVINSYRL
ncbi:MAG: uroporphyrinogen decarboxylase family protein [Armatimonadota bacterium]|nr:hypothetical protein [Armatimonadota bacterium]MDW8026510.1 uroporphyrinogen decarboxylase family protein [Armatimonadota bacterium]